MKWVSGRLILRNWKFLVLVGMPIILLPLLLIQDNDMIPATAEGNLPRPSTKFQCAYVIVLMSVYWMTEAVPLAVTGLLPVALFPLFNIMSTSSVTINYMRETIMVFIGGLIIAQAFEFCNLHRRIALKVLTIVGSSPIRLVFGIMLTTMFLSMWISNTATTAMMVPICLAILQELKQEEEEQRDNNSKKPLEDNMFLYSIACSSNIGGTGVLTGTLANLILFEMLQERDIDQGGKYTDLTFTTWMAFSIPGVLINTLIAWIYLVLFFGLSLWNKKSPSEDKVNGMLSRKYKALGPISFHEMAVTLLFLLAVFLWLFRDPRFIKGWSEYIIHAKVGDSTSAMLVVALLFIIPKDRACFSGGSKDPLLDWKFVQDHVPWGIILFMGGGFALSEGANASGLSLWVGEKLNGISGWDERLILLIAMVLTTTLTEVMSNSATISILLPILLTLSESLNLHPLYLTLPATIACSYAFMLPVGSPSNAIIYGAAGGRMHIMDLVKTGAFLKFSSIGVLFLINISYGNLLFGYSDYVYPNATTTKDLTSLGKLI